jgi:hypothetical protein
VVSEIGNVGKIQLEVCGKSASFGSRTYISYRGETSGDIQCVSQNAPEPQPELNKALADAMLTIACYQNEGSYCQTIDEMKTSGIDSGIEGSVWAVPVPYCHNPAPLAPGDNNPCGITDNFSATFLITKSDGTTVKKVTTDAGGNLDAVLPAGNYILSDLTAGTSTMPHPFVNGAISTMYQPSDYHTSYAFIVSAHTITSLSPEFDGTSFK